jgi:hypothetical protein
MTSYEAFLRSWFSDGFGIKTGLAATTTDRQRTICGREAGLPDFPWYNVPKGEKYRNEVAKIFQNGHKMYQMSVK